MHKGFIVYTRSKNKLVEIVFTRKDFDDLAQTIKQILFIIQKGFYPKKTSSKKRCHKKKGRFG